MIYNNPSSITETSETESKPNVEISAGDLLKIVFGLVAAWYYYYRVTDSTLIMNMQQRNKHICWSANITINERFYSLFHDTVIYAKNIIISGLVDYKTLWI